MIRKNKNKLRLEIKSKILVLGIILIIVLVGLFSPIRKVNAATDTPTTPTAPLIPVNDCKLVNGQFIPAGCNSKNETSARTSPAAPATKTPTNFEAYIANQACFSLGSVNPFSDGCFEKLFYTLFHGIPAFFLWVSGMFFNVLLSVSLSSNLLKSSFVGQAWGIVRDLSNIFFILILLYIAIKIILGLGGSEVKKMIANVIIIALLINFSMFFTTVIIDSSNILALIFYNKMTVDTKSSAGTERPYSGIGGEKDISGGLVNSFDPTKIVGENFFKQAAIIYGPDGLPLPANKQDGKVPLTIILSVILLSGAVMCFAAYVFFISGIFFLGRLIELWILIIFSPFAFISSTVPQLSGVSDIGWKAWFDRLLSTAFMAPIFMFFLYFIFMLVSNKSVFDSIIPKSTNNDGVTGMIKIILGVVLPSILICVLLIKAKNYAKKGSGAIGEMVMKGAKMVGGMALGVAGGAAIGAVAAGGRATVGRIGSAISNSETIKKWEKEGKYGSSFAAAKLRDVGKAAGSASYDVRGATVGGKTLASATGMNLGKAQEGGFEKRKKEQVENRTKRAKELETGEGTKAKHYASVLEADLRTAKANKATELAKVEKEIGDLRQKMQDQKAAGLDTDAKATYVQLEGKQKEKKEKRGVITNPNGTTINIEGGIAYLESELNKANDEINAAEIASMNEYANIVKSTGSKLFNTIVTLGQYSSGGADIAADRIRKGVKIEETKK